MLARYYRRHLSICSSVHQSVTLRYCIKAAKYTIMQERHTIASGLQFSETKDLGENRTGSPHLGHQMQVG